MFRDFKSDRNEIWHMHRLTIYYTKGAATANHYE